MCHRKQLCEPDTWRTVSTCPRIGPKLTRSSYINSDYGVSSAFRGMQGLSEIVLSYDIACQYSRRFKDRFTASPTLQLPDCSLLFAIPKFHLPAHKEDCRYFYSFNYLKKVGRTDGEAIERFWSRLNFLSGSTRKMSPESRLDTLNAHMADWNWRKLCGMGKSCFSLHYKAVLIVCR
jgi:hypothetical protein